MQQESYNQIHLKKATLRRHLENCDLCPRMCGVNRLEGQTGFCGLELKAHCFREMINTTEEEGLVPSHQVYFSGCNLRCGFCSVEEWNVKPADNPEIEISKLAKIIESKRSEGAVNLNLLGGEPSVSVYGILDLLERISQQTQVVWNSNMYFNKPVIDALDGLVSLYLADFKCGNNVCSAKMLGVSDYVETVKENLVFASKNADLIIRHLFLPGHFDCCGEPVLEWIAGNLPDSKVSLRLNYIPPIPAGNCPGVYLSEDEIEKAKKKVKHLGLNIIYTNNDGRTV